MAAEQQAADAAKGREREEAAATSLAEARARAEQRATGAAEKRLAAERRAEAALQQRLAGEKRAAALVAQRRAVSVQLDQTAASRTALESEQQRLHAARPRRKWLGEAVVALACVIGVVLYFVAFPGPQPPAPAARISAQGQGPERPLELRLDDGVEKIPAGLVRLQKKK